MYRYFLANFVFFLLIVSLLANALGWAFHGEIFVHALENHPHTHFAAQSIHEDHQHKELSDETNLNPSAHICLNVAYQPFFITKLPSVPLTAAGKEIPAKFTQPQLPESIIDSPFRPPRIIIPS